MFMAEKVIVIGSGPAGLMAAITAAQAGRAVTVLEALPSPGRKLLASGAGKCNFTNMLSPEAMAERFAPEQRRFVKPSLLGFTPDEVRKFFAGCGVKYTLVDDFYCFPATEKASDILQSMLNKLQEYGGRIVCNAMVYDLQIQESAVSGVYAGKEFYACDYLIAAAGGPGFPKLGGGGSLDKIFAGYGIDMIKRTPALCGIKSSDSWLQDLAGMVLDKVTLTLNKHNFSHGTMLFTGDGISGPAALDLAGRCAKLLDSGEKITAKVNFRPDKTREDWRIFLDHARRNSGKRLIRNLFVHELPQALAAALVQNAGAGEITAAQMTGSTVERLLDTLTACPLHVASVENWAKAMASTGGMARSGIDSKTMQSKKIANLYAAGEFIDVDGPCGGYNIQWALSSGKCAGMLKTKKQSNPAQ